MIVSHAALLLRDNGICWLCGEAVGLARASRDHVIPKAAFVPVRGFDNRIRLAHKKCNSRRGHLPPTRLEARTYYDGVVAEYIARHVAAGRPVPSLEPRVKPLKPVMLLPPALPSPNEAPVESFLHP